MGWTRLGGFFGLDLGGFDRSALGLVGLTFGDGLLISSWMKTSVGMSPTDLLHVLCLISDAHKARRASFFSALNKPFLGKVILQLVALFLSSFLGHLRAQQPLSPRLAHAKKSYS